MALLRNLFLACVLMTLPGLAHADTKPAPGAGMTCPMMGNAAAIRQDMGAMMTDMSAMMKDIHDPAIKARMQKMHEQMATMMANMHGMHGGMMRGSPDSAPAAAAPDDHGAHHPKQ
ncbi:MAG TPA: hypothetical protein VJS47_11605 [Rhizomicrobium sp.]|nr:hypothetical protein [Rhizomicrobium sp.]